MRKNLISLLICLCSVSLMAEHAVGVDLSLLPAYEEAKVAYYEENGSTRIPDVLSWLVQNKSVNYVRVRLFVDPTNDWARANSFNKPKQLGGNLSTVTALGQRIKASGAQFLLDLHYSDAWADPARQVMPKRWADTCTTYQQLQDSVYQYTHDVLTHLVASGAAPDMVQVGNEITYGMFYAQFSNPVNGTDYVNYGISKAGQAGLNCLAHSSGSYNTEGRWTNFTNMLKAGIQAVREVCPNAQVMLHIERSGQDGVARAWFEKMAEYNVDYDIMALSYYPEYHGTIATLVKTLNALESAIPDKEIMLAEYGYSNGWAIGGSGGKTPGQVGFYKKDDPSKSCPQAQADLINALVDELANHPRVTGMFYWFPEENESDWNHQGPYASPWRNTGLWANEASNVASNLSPALSVKKGAALPGLNALARFSDRSEDVRSVWCAAEDNAWYTLLGIRMTEAPTAQGVYLHAGKKVMIP